MAFWFNEEYIYRKSITLDFSTTNSIPANHDVEITVPSDWDLFWDTIRSDFLDVVVTDANGVVQQFQRKAGANYANKNLVLQLDNIQVPAPNSLVQFFVYYGYATESTDRSSSITITAPKNGYIFLGAPLARIVDGYGLVPTANAPTTTFVKQTTEEIDVFFSFRGLLETRITESNGRLLFEEVEFVIVNSLDTGGSNSDSRYDLAATRFLGGYVVARAKGGANNTDYAFLVRLSTTNKQIYDIRCLMKTKDLLPT